MILRRLLFLYMVPETGHQKAADAIMKAAAYMNPRVECVGIDAASHAYPVIGNVFNRMYLQMIQRLPGIWDYLYDNPDIVSATKEAREFVTLISSFRTKRLLSKYRPDAVICTQAAPATAMAAEKRRGNLKVPLICTITDFGVHSYWYHDEVDLYLVAHDDIKQEMIRKGIDEDRIRVTGIPINPKFGEVYDPVEQRHRLKIDANKRTLLLMGGSRGLGSLDEVVEALKTIPADFQTIVVCGKNRKMQKQILELTRGFPDFRVFGYIKDMSPVMGAADILISKPGGLTSSEALAKQLPMVLTDPIPGQEERNVQFLTRHAVARVARSREELIHIVSDLLRHPKKLLMMRHRAKIISRPFSAWEAARLIFASINNRPFDQ